MIFTDLRFIALFIGCWITFFALPHRWRAAVLALWGALFYFLYTSAFFFVVVGLVAIVFFSFERTVAWFAGALTLALLVYFKLTAAGGPLTAAADASAILIPLGFSYLSFELLHVVIERRRGRIGALEWPELFAFAFFAPARIAGPIKRFPQFTAAVRDAKLSMENVYWGVLRILFGLSKKFFLADILGLTVQETSGLTSLRHAWTVALAYSFQLFFDFSAYSDIAIGFARTLGVRLPENFEWPYLAKNIREFWDRWHITLSHWVRDYIFLPLGRQLFQTRLRRAALAIAAISYLVTFAAVGAWHGLTVAFIVWGLYHGVLLTLYHIIRLKTPAAVAQSRWYRSRIADAISIAVTFLCVTIGWVPFMLPLKSAGRMLAMMFGLSR